MPCCTRRRVSSCACIARGDMWDCSIDMCAVSPLTFDLFLFLAEGCCGQSSFVKSIFDKLPSPGCFRERAFSQWCLAQLGPDLLRRGPHTRRAPGHVLEQFSCSIGRFLYWHQFGGELDQKPRGGGRTHVFWRGWGSEHGLQVPCAVPGGVYQVNRARFEGL